MLRCLSKVFQLDLTNTLVMMEGSKRKLNALTIEKKVEVLQFYDCNPSMRKSDIATKFGIPPSTLSTILKNRDYIERNYHNNKGKVKKLRRAAYPELEECLREWFVQSCENGFLVSGPMLKHRAEDFAKQLGFDDFKASNGWFESFKNRQNIVFGRLHGENALVGPSVCEEWFKELYYILEGYDPDDVFSASETGLFFQCLPTDTGSYNGKKWRGCERSKSRLTFLLAANQSGSTKLPLLMIGQEAKPKCLAHVKSSPMDYKANGEARMTQDIFVNWLNGVDKSMATKGRKILLFIDDCKAHSNLPKLENVTVKYFPPTLASKLRPLDQGIIKSFKTEYRKLVVRKLLNCINESKSFPTINVLDAMRMADSAWRNVTEKTIKNCFVKAGLDKISNEEEMQITNLNLVEGEDDDVAVEQWEELKRKQNLCVSFHDFVNVDTTLQTRSTSTDIEIASNDSDGGEQQQRECQTVTVEEAEKAINTLRTFLESSEDISSESFASIDILEKVVLKQKFLNMHKS